MEQSEKYSVEIRDVYSGDDLVVMVDLGVESLWKKQRVRLRGVDTPNAIHAGDDSEAGRVRYLVRSLARGRTGTITVTNRNSAGGWVVELEVNTPDGPLNLNAYLIQRGFKYSK